MAEYADVIKQLTEMVKSQSKQHAEAMKAVEKRHEETVDLLRQQIDELRTGRSFLNDSSDRNATKTAELLATLSQRIRQKFDMESDGSYAFSVWYGRYRELFTVDGACLDDKAKVRLLLEQLSDTVHESYKRQLMPDDPYGKSFDESVKKLTELYDSEVSKFTQRYQCLKIEKGMDESLLDYTGRVNESCERAKVHDMTADDIKCLVWVFGLKDSSELELRQRLLLFLDKRRSASDDSALSVNLQDLQREALRFINLKKESDMIQNGDVATVSIAHKSNSRGSNQRNRDSGRSNQSRQWNSEANRSGGVTCFRCDGDHSSWRCEYKEYACSNCGKTGHHERCCWKDSRTGEDSGDSDGMHQPRKRANIRAVRVSNLDPRPVVDVVVQGITIPMTMDTGSEISLFSLNDYQKFEGLSMTESDCDLYNFAGQQVEILGMVSSEFSFGTCVGHGDAYVTPFESVIGMDWLRQSEDVRHHLKAMTECHEDSASQDGSSIAMSIRKCQSLTGEETDGSLKRSHNVIPKRCRRTARRSRNSKTKVIVAVNDAPIRVQSPGRAQVVEQQTSSCKSEEHDHCEEVIEPRSLSPTTLLS
jgi:hypothetical protein